MPTPFAIIVPANDEQLRIEIEQQLALVADVQEGTPAFALAETLLIVQLVAGGATIAANTTTLIKNLLDLRDRLKQKAQRSGVRVGVLGGKSVPLEDTDEELLRRLLEGEGGA